MPGNPGDKLVSQAQLVHALATALLSGGQVRLFETHISWVLVSGDYAYKIKKAVHFDFLDFSTLAARRHYCEEECRLNRRLASELYLDVLAVTGSADSPQLAGASPAIEYVLRMHAFAQDKLWSERIAAGTLAPEEVDQLADRLLRFHQDAPQAPADSPWGTPAQLLACADDILATLNELLQDAPSRAKLAALLEWHRSRHAQLSATFDRRKQAGYVREGHGDLHCGNLLTLNGQATAFDCIEFSEELRWIDVQNDLAFAVMDLHVLGRPDLAARLLNRYLEGSSDYSELEVLRYYLVLRALVRCKVHLLYLQELAPDDPQRADCESRMQAYLTYAGTCMQPNRAALMITHGFSGSGKSTVAGMVVEAGGALRIRSDVERKRLYGLDPLSHMATANDLLYATSASEATYARLSAMARSAITAGWPVIVDAAFLDREQRQSFARLAQELNVPFLIVDIRASEAIMHKRLAQRAIEDKDPSDASAAVLAHQLATHDPLSAEEMAHVLPIDSVDDAVGAAVRAAVAKVGL
jgi:hypothetical protein